MFGLLFQFELSLKSLAVQIVWAWVAQVRGEDTGNKKRRFILRVAGMLQVALSHGTRPCV